MKMDKDMISILLLLATHDLFHWIYSHFRMIAARDIIMNTNNIRTLLWSESKEKNERRWNEEDSRAEVNIKNQHTKQKIEIEWARCCCSSAKKKNVYNYFSSEAFSCALFFSVKRKSKKINLLTRLVECDFRCVVAELRLLLRTYLIFFPSPECVFVASSYFF